MGITGPDAEHLFVKCPLLNSSEEFLQAQFKELCIWLRSQQRRSKQQQEKKVRDVAIKRLNALLSPDDQDDASAATSPSNDEDFPTGNP